MSTEKLLATNVNAHVESKNGLSYLSWVWAWAEVLKADPLATWEPILYGGSIMLTLPDGTGFVGVQCTVLGVTRQCVLPVMDHRNKAISNPDAFAVNKNLMRCLAKAIAMHGLGLYIYAGEDLPEAPPVDVEAEYAVYEAANIDALRDAAMSGEPALAAAFKALSGPYKARLWKTHGNSLKAAAKAAGTEDGGAK